MRVSVPGMTGDDTHKARNVMATDSEWQIIGERAKLAGMSISRFIVERATMSTATDDDNSLPTPLRRRVARDVLILSRIEELRYQRAGETEAWQQLVDAAEIAVEAEETAGR